MSRLSGAPPDEYEKKTEDAWDREIPRTLRFFLCGYFVRRTGAQIWFLNWLGVTPVMRLKVLQK